MYSKEYRIFLFFLVFQSFVVGMEDQCTTLRAIVKKCNSILICAEDDDLDLTIIYTGLQESRKSDGFIKRYLKKRRQSRSIGSSEAEIIVQAPESDFPREQVFSLTKLPYDPQTYNKNQYKLDLHQSTISKYTIMIPASIGLFVYANNLTCTLPCGRIEAYARESNVWGQHIWTFLNDRQKMNGEVVSKKRRIFGELPILFLNAHEQLNIIRN